MSERNSLDNVRALHRSTGSNTMEKLNNFSIILEFLDFSDHRIVSELNFLKSHIRFKYSSVVN